MSEPWTWAVGTIHYIFRAFWAVHITSHHNMQTFPHVTTSNSFFVHDESYGLGLYWRPTYKIAEIQIFCPLPKCKQVDRRGPRWADRFEKIPICQISTATSGPDSPSPPTEISLAGGRMRIHFRISGEVLVVLRGGCWKKSIISDKIWNNNGSHEDAEEVLTVLREGCWIILRFVGWLPEYDQLRRMLWNQI